MAYSVDFRERAIAFMDSGHTYKELYDVFKIYPSAIEDWRKLLKENGSLAPQYDKRDSSRKIDLSKLEQAIREKPDAYLDELAQQFGCTKQAIFYAQKRLRITYKKNADVL